MCARILRTSSNCTTASLLLRTGTLAGPTVVSHDTGYLQSLMRFQCACVCILCCVRVYIDTVYIYIHHTEMHTNHTVADKKTCPCIHWCMCVWVCLSAARTGARDLA